MKKYVCTECGKEFESYTKRKYCGRCIIAMFCKLRQRDNARKALRGAVVELRKKFTRREIGELTGLNKDAICNLIIEWGEND